MFLTIITFILVLSVIVFAHELGHFWTAKKFGLVPEEFGFGLPPRAIGWYKDKEGRWKTVKGGKKVEDAADTIYSVNWLPLGGFVKLGEDETEVDPNSNHFHNKPAWQRMIILLAGVTMNIILAMALISVGFMIGFPTDLSNEDLPVSARVKNERVQIVNVLPETPAANAGLELGDFVISADGNAIKNESDLESYNQVNVGKEVEYSIVRGDREMTFTIIPEVLDETESGGIGVGISRVGRVVYPFHIAIWQGIKTTVSFTWLILSAFGALLLKLLSGSGISADVAGPVGIAIFTGQAARMGFVYILQFAAVLSVNLAIINALPFPALDGGRVIFVLIEKMKGSPVKKEVEGTIHYIGFALLMLLILVVTFKDVDRYTGIFKTIAGWFS